MFDGATADRLNTLSDAVIRERSDALTFHDIAGPSSRKLTGGRLAVTQPLPCPEFPIPALWAGMSSTLGPETVRPRTGRRRRGRCYSGSWIPPRPPPWAASWICAASCSHSLPSASTRRYHSEKVIR